VGLTKTIKEGNTASSQDKEKVALFICKQYECLTYDYLTVKDPSILRKNLKERYDHQKKVLHPTTRDEWNI